MQDPLDLENIPEDSTDSIPLVCLECDLFLVTESEHGVYHECRARMVPESCGGPFQSIGPQELSRNDIAGA
jgi:hypothetical protein